MGSEEGGACCTYSKDWLQWEGVEHPYCLRYVIKDFLVR